MSAALRRVIVAGAGGVFGSLLVAELARQPQQWSVVPTTRRELDLSDVDAVATAARGAYAFACAAGPFQKLDRRIVRAVVEAGSHWLDIADDPEWFFGLLDDPQLDALAKQQNVAVIPGLSSLPAISGALVRRLAPAPGGRVDITLRINNRNRKGAAAMASFAGEGGGNFSTPDVELLRREMGIDARVHIAFEAPGAAALLRLLGLVPGSLRHLIARLLSIAARPLSRIGTPGGYVEARTDNNVTRITARDQRFAILPLVFALQHVDSLRGCIAPLRAWHSEALLQFVEQ